MKTILSVITDITSYFNPRTKRGVLRLAALLIIFFVLFNVFADSSSDEAASASQTRTVETARVSTFSNGSKIELIGSVESISQAEIQSESSGRVTSVEVSLGQTVGAGTAIVRLENASEYASLLQAEGAYEAALASAAQSDVSVTEAEIALKNAQNNSVNTYRNAFSTFRTILISDVDVIFSDPQASTPGVRIDGGSSSSYLNTERVAFNSILKSWQASSNAVNSDNDLVALLFEADSALSRLAKLLDIIIERLQISDGPGNFTDDELSTLLLTFQNNKSAINTQLAAIDVAETSLLSAEQNLARTQLGGTNPEVSAANAQVKQALGSLRAAQANYNKTILSTPVAGVVNSLDVKSGDFIGAFTTVATVANNSALEITTFVGETDRDLLNVGQKVVIEGGFEGIISNIAPAVNPTTKKIEVKIQTETEEISNGDTVRITVESSTGSRDTTDVLLIPLTAVKFNATAGSVLTIADGTIVSNPVELGAVRGSLIEIVSGLTKDVEIIVDARGLNIGQSVEPVN